MTLLVPTGLGSTGLWACGHHAVKFFHLVGISVCVKQLTGFGSECYLWPSRRH